MRRLPNPALQLVAVLSGLWVQMPLSRHASLVGLIRGTFYHRTQFGPLLIAGEDHQGIAFLRHGAALRHDEVLLTSDQHDKAGVRKPEIHYPLLLAPGLPKLRRPLFLHAVLNTPVDRTGACRFLPPAV